MSFLVQIRPWNEATPLIKVPRVASLERVRCIAICWESHYLCSFSYANPHANAIVRLCQEWTHISAYVTAMQSNCLQMQSVWSAPEACTQQILYSWWDYEYALWNSLCPLPHCVACWARNGIKLAASLQGLDSQPQKGSWLCSPLSFCLV